MKTKSKSAQIREALLSGEASPAIAKQLKVPISYVYNEKYKLKKATPKKRVVLRRAEAEIATKLGIPLKDYAKTKMKMEQEEKQKQTPSIEQQLYIDDLMEIKKQIDTLETIASFLKIRIEQMQYKSK